MDATTAQPEPLTPTELGQLLREISHELRTPLGAAMIWIRIFHDGKEEAQRARAMVMFEESLNELLQLAHDLSDCSALIESKLELERTPMALNRLIAEIVKRLRPRAERRGIQLEIENDSESDIVIQGDHERLGRSFEAILGYAMTCRTPESRLPVRLDTLGDVVRLTIPLAAASATALQTLRSHLRDGAARFGSSGLTLPIAVELVRLHGGAVEVGTGPDGDQVVLTLRRYRG